MSAEALQSTSGVRKAAILLSLIGEEASAPVLRNLHERDLKKVTEEIASLNTVSAELTLQVLQEYQQIMAAQEFVAVGGQDVAVRLLGKAFGENSANDMMQKMTMPEEQPSFKSDALKKADPQQLARLLAGEQAQTRALILGNLEAKQASALLMRLEPDVRVDCIKRLATMGKFSPEIAAKVSNALIRRLGTTGERTKKTGTGIGSLAEVMNGLEPASAREILEKIESEEPSLAIGIRDLMFTFENFLGVPEPDLRELMNSVDKKTLMIAMKGASEDLRTHIYRTMSSRAVDMMKEDSEMMGPVRGRDAAKAQSEIVAIARKLEAEGKIVLKSEGEDEYVL